MCCCAIGSGAAISPQMFWTWGALDLNNTTAARFMPSASSEGPVSSTENVSTVVVGRAGTLTDLRVRIQTALAAGRDLTFTVRVNGVNTGLTVTVTGGNQVGNISGSVAVAAGDRVTLQTQVNVADGTNSRCRATVLWR